MELKGRNAAGCREGQRRRRWLQPACKDGGDKAGSACREGWRGGREGRGDDAAGPRRCLRKEAATTPGEVIPSTSTYIPD